MTAPKRLCRALTLIALALPVAASARDSLGIFAGWGAFRDTALARCYAIAVPQPSSARKDYTPYASIGSWPKRGVRNQLHLRLARRLAPDRPITLRLGSERFPLTGGGGDAWAEDRQTDAAIIAAMRSAESMTVTATDTNGRRFSSTYALSGAATAMDAATIGCAKLR